MLLSTCLLVLGIFSAAYAAPAYKYTGCPNGTVWQPTPGTTWMWDLSKTVSEATIDTQDVQVYDFDFFYITPAMVTKIHAKGSVLICYIDTAYEPYRPDANRWLPSDLGNKMDGWPDQRWVNVESANVRELMLNRTKAAKALGCDAIEWDDVDAYKNDPGFKFNGTVQANFNAYLARITHEYNMSVGLKNDLDQIPILEPYFDWVLNEQCYQYDECDLLEPFRDAGKAVFGAEYKNDAKKVCSKQNSLDFSWIRTDLDLTGDMTLCCSYKNPPCQGVQHQCIAPPTEYPYLYDYNDSASSVAMSLLVVFACTIFALL